jgi:ABC-type dipeptide/oligopeptide/nickel transport system permease component
MSFYFRKTGQYLLALFGVLTLSFFLVYKAPAGDPTKTMLGFQATEEDIRSLRRELGLDRPLIVQYAIYCKRLLTGNLGRSFISDFDIGRELARRFPLTLALAATATLIALVGGVLLGLLSVLYKKADPLVAFFAIGLGSVPVFYLGLLVVWFFGYKLNLFPISGYKGGMNVLPPALVLALHPMANVARITAVELGRILKQDYIRTAYAMGFPRRRVVGKFALKNALLSVVSSLSNGFAMLLSGTFFVEYIFGWPGVGLLAVDAMLNYDYPVIQSIVLLTAVSFILINLATDFLYALVDPRVRG